MIRTSLIAGVIASALIGVSSAQQMQLAGQRIEVKCPPAEDVAFHLHAEDRVFLAKAGAGWITKPSATHPNANLWPSELDQWSIHTPAGVNGKPLPVIARATDVDRMTVWPEENRVRCSYRGALNFRFEATLVNCTPEGDFRVHDGGASHSCALVFNEVQSVRDQCSATCDRPIGAARMLMDR